MPSKESYACLLLAVATCFGLAIASSAQIIHASGPLPSFEVATIKPASSQTRLSSTSPTEVHISNVSVRNLIEQAYGIPWTSAENDRVLGGPAWLDTNPARLNPESQIHAFSPTTRILPRTSFCGDALF